MEVHIAETSGLPEDAILSIRAGGTRRQTALPPQEPLRFPNLPFNAQHFKVDVMQSLGFTRLDLKPVEIGSQVKVPIQLQDGSQASVAFTIKEEPKLCGKRAAELKQFEALRREGLDELPDAPINEERLQAAVDARAYSRQHNLGGVVQEMLQYVLREKPDSPYMVMAEYFRQRAEEMGEVGGVNSSFPPPNGKAVAESSTMSGRPSSSNHEAPVRAQASASPAAAAPVKDQAEISSRSRPAMAGSGAQQARPQSQSLSTGPPPGQSSILQQRVAVPAARSTPCQAESSTSQPALPSRALPQQPRQEQREVAGLGAAEGLDMERLKLEAENVQLRKERAHLLKELADLEALPVATQG